jgi:hypothetical protein
MWVTTTIARYFEPVHPQKSPQRFREDGNATNGMWFFSAAQESTDSTVHGGTKCGTGIMAKMLRIYDPTSDQCLFHDSRLRQGSYARPLP